MQGSAKMDKARTIQTQSRNGGSPRRCNPDDLSCIVAPREMLCPLLLSRMKERSLPFRYGVNPRLERAFETVASQTRERKVRFVCGTASRFGDDMLNGKRIRVKPAETAAVFTLA